MLKIIKRPEDKVQSSVGNISIEDLTKSLSDEVYGSNGRPSVDKSPVTFKTIEGKELMSYGVNSLGAIVSSPLVEEGSGQGLYHPESYRNFVCKKTIRLSISQVGSSKTKINLQDIKLLNRGDWVAFGSPMVKVNFNSQDLVYKTWSELSPGIITKDPSIEFNTLTNNYDIKFDVLMISKGNAEKHRGPGKWRSNGGFLRNIKIQKGSKLIFDPNKPLKDDDNNFLQVENVVGPEEYKTPFYLISLIAHYLGGVTWDAACGKWLEEDQIDKEIDKRLLYVDVERNNLHPEIFTMFLNTYGDKEEFEFYKETNSIIHRKAPCWVGVVTHIIEVPLTLAFTGKGNLFLEQVLYLGSEYPILFNKLKESIKRNSEGITNLINAAKYQTLFSIGAIDDLISKGVLDQYLIITKDTEISLEGDKRSLEIDEAHGLKFLRKLQLPKDFKFTSESLQNMAYEFSNKSGMLGFIFLAEGKDQVNWAVIPFKGFFNCLVSSSQKAFRDFVNLFSQLSIPNNQINNGNNKVLDKRDSKWETNYNKLVSALASFIRFQVVDASSLVAQASKTEDIAIVCKVGSTLDGSVLMHEAHMSKATLDIYNLNPKCEVILDPDNRRVEVNSKEEFDRLVSQRVPVPGCGILEVVRNDNVPAGTIVLNAAQLHAISEADGDGDLTSSIVVNHEGEFKIMKTLKRINPTQ